MMRLMPEVYDTILAHLDGLGISYRAVSHEPTSTSEESAKARGEDIRVGGKALLIKTGDVFRLFVLSAALKLDAEAAKVRFGVKKIRFATADELKELTGLVPGSVPPFGRPILPFDLFIDESITRNERIAFNAGSLTQSLILGVPDYLRAAQGEVFSFSVPAG
jgi:prolyl-tRNA editing enzyme YbaK/EbsC (Cys-tRNA(Pro) deacylase)